MQKPAFVTMCAAPVSRRSALRLAALALGTAVCSTRPSPSYALKPGKPSKEKLLSGIGKEKTEEEIEAEKERIAEERKERLEKQRLLREEAERKKQGLSDAEPEAEIESNLRGQYYYPTARKRYLPRVKLASESIPSVLDAVDGGRWAQVAELKTVLDDAALPLKLYASSLGGGGLNLSSKFIEGMLAQATAYENSIKVLGKAVKKKDSSTARSALKDLDNSIEQYRKLGKLTAPDFGIGEIPTDNKVGSGFSNNNSALYNKNKAVQVTKSPGSSE